MHFAQKNWEPFVYQRLNDIIEQYRQPDQTPTSQRAYAVFDFDNTSAIGDVEDNLMMYFLDHLIYRLSPDELYEIMTSGPFAFDTMMEPGNLHLTPRNLALDIRMQYEWLFNHYIHSAELTLAAVKQTEQYRDFSAKLRYYYKWVNTNFKRLAGEPWLTYWFSGYTPEELIALTRLMLKEALVKPFKVLQMTSSPQFPGHTGVVETNFVSGLSFPPELIDLYVAFQQANIETYVVSASPIDVVRTAATEYGYNVPRDHVIGMRYSLNSEGRIQAKMAPETYITKQAGKTEAIKQLIAPHFENRQPIALFGDSMGDYDMMMRFDRVALNVLFNCYHQDNTQDIVDIALGSLNQANAKYVLQGRDENQGSLRASSGTIPIGKKTEVVSMIQEL